MRTIYAFLITACLAVLTIPMGRTVRSEPLQPAAIGTQDVLFEATKVWTAHLTFTPEQWKAMEPTRGRPTGRTRFTGGEWLQGDNGNRNGWAAALGIEFNYTHANLDFHGNTFRDVGVRFKGNGTYRGPTGKTSLKVDLNKYVKGQKLAGVTTLNFQNNTTDAGYMNEVLAYRLYRDAGVPAPRTAYVRMYITVLGSFDKRYYGLYSLSENVDPNFIQARFGTDKGAILKPVSVKPFSDLGDVWEPYVQVYDPKTDLTDADQRRIMEFCKFLAGATDAEFAARIDSYVDLDAFARYMTVVAWMNNWDSILKNGQNYYVHMDPATHRMRFIAWDQDSSWGAFFQQPPGTHALGDVFKPWPEQVRFLERVFGVPKFRDAYLARMRELSNTVFQPSQFASQVSELAAVLRPVVAEEPTSRAVAEFDRVARGETGLLVFARERAASVRKQLGLN